MSVSKFATIAGVVLIVVLCGTFLITQTMAPAKRFEDCMGGRVAGGAIGGSFELVDHMGKIVSDVEVLDQPTLVYFGYTFCPDVCPMDVARNSTAVEILAESGLLVKPVFITIDPERDTPEYLADFVTNIHPDMIGLTGTVEQVAKVARSFKVFYRKQPSDDPDYYFMDHSTFTYLMMPEIGFVNFLRSDISPQNVADHVACVIKAA